MRGFLLFHGWRAASRLRREIIALRISMEHSYNPFREASWYVEALFQVEQAQAFLENGDVEGGWYCFHLTRRLLISGMTDDELRCEATTLLEEAVKLSHWRRKVIEKLLPDPAAIDRSCLAQAFKMRDEYNANQYHKIWLTSDQLRLLCFVTGIAALVTLASLIFLPQNQDEWSARTLLAVSSFGILGAGFSVSQTMIGMASASKIPDYVANQWTTFMRTLFGSVTALAGYVFFASKILKISLGDDQNQLASYLAVAFVFGYGGEKLIKKIYDTVGSSDSGK